MPIREWLWACYVKSRSSNLSRRQSIHKCIRIHEPTARNIHENRRRFHHGKLCATDKPSSATCHRGSKHNHVSARQHLVQAIRGHCALRTIHDGCGTPHDRNSRPKWRQQLHERDAAKLAVAEERLRIARELHDVLGHSMSVIAVQSDAAGAALGQDPDLARKPLQVIHATARGSLAEIRAMLEVLHGDSGQEPGGPGLDELRTLLEANALAGLDVSGTISPGLPALSPAAGLVVFRVVQESLTNVLKHAGPVPAVVSVAPEGPGVRVEIRNGPGAGSGHDSGSAGSAGHAAGPPGSAGYGLQGLRERVGQVGGTFGAGAGDGGGWLVWAVVPAQAGGGEEPP